MVLSFSSVDESHSSPLQFSYRGTVQRERGSGIKSASLVSFLNDAASWRKCNVVAGGQSLHQK